MEEWKIICLILLAVFVLSVILTSFIVYKEVNFGEIEGTIIKKEYIPERTLHYNSYVNKRPIMQTVHQDEKFRLTIQKLINNELKVKNVYVDKNIFNKYNIGDYYIQTK